jgi:hypothetical protein
MAIETSGQLEAAQKERDDLAKRKDEAKKSQTRLDKLRRAKYNSSTRTYRVDGQSLSTSEYNKEIDSLTNSIEEYNKTKTNNEQRIKELDKQIKNASMISGASAEQQQLGKEYQRLVKEADAIKVKDFESGLKSIEAWNRVRQFAEENPEGVFVLRTGTAGSGERAVELKKTQKLSDRFDDIDRTINNVAAKTDEFASKGLVKFETRFVREDGKTKQVRERIVLDPTELENRRSQIDNAVRRVAPSGQQPATPTDQRTQTSAGITGAAQRTVGAAVRQTQGSTSAPMVGPGASAAQITAAQRNVGRTPAGGGTGGTGGTPSPGKRPATGKKGERWTGPKGKVFEWNGKKWVPVSETGMDTTSSQWQQIIQEEFGSIWDVYNGNADVKAVIDQSVKEGWHNDEVKLNAALSNTGWYRTTQASARQFALRQSTDPASVESEIVTQTESIRQYAANLGLNLNDNSLRKVAVDTLKFNYSDQQIMNAVGSEAVAQATLGGPQGVTDLSRGAAGRTLRAKAKEYGQRPDDNLIEQWTQDILTGNKTQEQWTELLTNQARTQFRSLQPALDRGETVESAMSAYKQQANRVLEGLVDVDQIDWTDDKWNKALNYRDEKTNEYRQMDTWEWNRYLRSLPEWQQTQTAKDTYRDVAFALAKGFGRMA